jgi:ATP-binding protein involved in chromosome partitioning
MDPRPLIIDKRLEAVKRIVAVSGGKGGIGKSSVAAVLALILAREGRRVGLLDLDFAGPSAHVILGAKQVMPVEEKGLIPPLMEGISFMSLVLFSGNRPTPLRGTDVSNAIVELLAVTIWGSLDMLIIDMPPGIGDATLDVIRLIKRMEFLTVTTPSRVATEVMKKELAMLKELGVPLIGIIENMRIGKHSVLERQAISLDIPFLGCIDLDPGLEDAIGNPDKLVETTFGRQLNSMADGLW